MKTVFNEARLWKRGVTLVELLVVMVIVMIVAGAVFTVLQLSMRNEARQQDIMTQTANLRAAFYAVGRDIRMAGSGLTLLGSPSLEVYVDPAASDPDIQDAAAGWYRYAGFEGYGARALLGLDSGTGGSPKSDMLTIFRTENEASGPLGFLNATFDPGASATMTLRDNVTEGDTISNGDMVAVASNGRAVIVQIDGLPAGVTTTNLPLGNRFRPAAPLPDGFTFPADSIVYNLRDVVFVTYYVDTDNHRLVANYHDVTMQDGDADDPAKQFLVTVAENIEDFQISYQVTAPLSTVLQDFTAISEQQLQAGNIIRAVELVVVSRSARRSFLTPGAGAIEVKGHTANTERGYTRRVMSETIQLRNF
jgi:prepilin-type N-terminal cleavage/methylation domain-containing protein